MGFIVITIFTLLMLFEINHTLPIEKIGTVIELFIKGDNSSKDRLFAINTSHKKYRRRAGGKGKSGGGSSSSADCSNVMTSPTNSIQTTLLYDSSAGDYQVVYPTSSTWVSWDDFF